MPALTPLNLESVLDFTEPEITLYEKWHAQAVMKTTNVVEIELHIEERLHRWRKAKLKRIAALAAEGGAFSRDVGGVLYCTQPQRKPQRV